MITIHACYRTKLWHHSENGPAAIISPGTTAYRDSPIKQYEFAGKLFSGEFNRDGHCDYRCGFLDTGAVKRVLIVSKRPLASEIGKTDGVYWLQLQTRFVRAAVEKCVELVKREKIGVVMIPSPKETFPSWTLHAISERLVEVAFGGLAVYRDEDLAMGRCRRSSPSIVNDGDDDDEDDNEGDEWKGPASVS